MNDELEIQNASRSEKYRVKTKKINRYMKRLSSASLHKDVGRVMESSGIGSPAEYLATVMSGEDPRIEGSRLLDIISGIRDRGLDELPSLDEWIEISEIISTNEMYSKVLLPIEHSTRAAEQLAKYLYSQKSESKNHNEVKAEIKIEPLSKKEMKRFKKIFESEF